MVEARAERPLGRRLWCLRRARARRRDRREAWLLRVASRRGDNGMVGDVARLPSRVRLPRANVRPIPAAAASPALPSRAAIASGDAAQRLLMQDAHPRLRGALRLIRRRRQRKRVGRPRGSRSHLTLHPHLLRKSRLLFELRGGLRVGVRVGDALPIRMVRHAAKVATRRLIGAQIAQLDLHAARHHRYARDRSVCGGGSGRR